MKLAVCILILFFNSSNILANDKKELDVHLLEIEGALNQIHLAIVDAETGITDTSEKFQSLQRKLKEIKQVSDKQQQQINVLIAQNEEFDKLKKKIKEVFIILNCMYRWSIILIPLIMGFIWKKRMISYMAAIKQYLQLMHSSTKSKKSKRRG